MLEYSISIGALTDKGNVKPSNQDSILVQIGEYKNGEFGLFVVCDGLGGLAFGEVASVMAVKKFRTWWDDEVKGFVKYPDDQYVIESLKRVIYDANIEILEYGNKINQRVGTTVSALLIIKDKYYIVHVGDSRIYKITNKINQLTEDHSYVAMQVKKGEITEQEAKNSKKRNLLLQCLGVKDVIEIYFQVGHLKGNESFVICSDGFYNTLFDYELLRRIRERRNNEENTLQELVDIMVQEVKNRRERDNISVILVELNKKYQTEKSILKKLFG